MLIDWVILIQILVLKYQNLKFVKNWVKKMNIFGFFLFLRFHTYYKSADDIKNIRNKLLSVQVTLLMFSSILMMPTFSLSLSLSLDLDHI